MADTNMFASFLLILAKYDLNTIILGIIAIVIAVITLCIELRKRFEEKVENQIILIDSLLAELETISSDYSEIYGGESTEGNLQWYIKEISSKNQSSLDHDINPISYDSYITKLNGNILKIIKFKKFVRTLSYVNDKIRQINYHTKKLQEGGKKKQEELRKWLLKVIDETKIKVGSLKKLLEDQKSLLNKIVKG